MSESNDSRLGYRGLWASVVLQALDDIEGQPIGSLEFGHAVAFFSGVGAWAESRTIIGDFLEFHRDDLEALGKRCINARYAREGLLPGTSHPPRNERPRTWLNLSGMSAFHGEQISTHSVRHGMGDGRAPYLARSG
jgi:hypothetical protein